MLRVPLLARGRVRTTWQAPSEGDAEAVRDYLSRLAADSHFREAVEISSPTLVRIWNRLLAGDAMHPTDRQKAVRALTRYWLRAATRPTPFGLMAGVLSTEFGDRAEGELHAGGCKAVRPDRGRLAKLVARWEQDPVIACRLRVTVNNLCLDPEPHLRLRFHGRPEVLHAQLLPRLHELARDLRLKGLARGLRLDTYVPETVRYGGPEAMRLAETAFFGDSRLALARLRAPGTDPLLDTACDVVELVRAFHQGYGASWSSWLTAVYPKDLAHHQAFVARRREALARISLDGSAKPDDALADVQGAMQGFGRRLCELAVDIDDVLGSVLHMHCNRRLGIDAKSESQVMAIARGAVQAHLDRRRAMA
ncbi:lantibiotic dehydratase [Pendulispora rubella]|uniref:Lantibiotic dehydratase n=1 Tax=Pendulispora rubella TaxID=2741070 RepID=A0ABZ2L565_9BACT